MYVEWADQYKGRSMENPIQRIAGLIINTHIKNVQESVVIILTRNAGFINYRGTVITANWRSTGESLDRIFHIGVQLLNRAVVHQVRLFNTAGTCQRESRHCARSRDCNVRKITRWQRVPAYCQGMRCRIQQG